MRRIFFVMMKIMSVGCLAFMLTSCAGVKCSINADRVDHPVSFTPCVYGAAGNVMRVSKQDTLKHFKIYKRCWAMLWRSVNITNNNWDISDKLTREMSSVNGDAIVNMTVLSQGDWWWYFSSLLPIIPDYHTIVIEGDVVRLQSEAKVK
ncbi:MAG: hypothetical protein NTX01_03620 [Candidatus Omnitrophica bacterium]|nr:hypothetical protein [Candidatus Omnitrophota bacterium]